jgi:hypothetical protein
MQTLFSDGTKNTKTIKASDDNKASTPKMKLWKFIVVALALVGLAIVAESYFSGHVSPPPAKPAASSQK